MHVDGGHSDEHYAALAQRGDADAFGVLVDRYADKLRRYGRKFLASNDDIEDIVQDVFVSVYRNIQSFDASLRFSPWIYRVAHNAYVNALRKSGRITFGFDIDALVSHHVHEDPAQDERDLRDMQSALDTALGKIPPKYREVLVLHYFEGLPYKDIADVLQIPIGTVSVRISRAKDALKKFIHKETP